MPKKEPDSLELMYQKRVQMTVSIAVITLGVILLFGGLGYLLDRYLGTEPALLLVFLIASFPVTQLLLFKRAKQIMKK